MHQEKPQAIAAAIEAFEPDLFVFLGDNVYGDVDPGSTDKLRDAYRRQGENAGFRRLLAAPHVLATWDDHDFGVNDGGGDFPLKREAEDLFLDFWQVSADDVRRSREGVYGSFFFGPPGARIQVILLDTRYFRSPLRPTDDWKAKGKEHYLPDAAPEKTFLGDAQWHWLEAALDAPADFRIVGSSIQFLAAGHGYERWGNFPAERERLLQMLERTSDVPTVVITGDRHFAALYRTELGPRRTLWEVTSSSLNLSRPGWKEQGPHQVGPVYGSVNFGSIEIDWQGRTAVLSIRGEEGQAVRQQTLLFDP